MQSSIVTFRCCKPACCSSLRYTLLPTLAPISFMPSSIRGSAMGETQGEAGTRGMVVRNRPHLPANLVMGGAVVAVFIVLAATGPWIAPFPFDQFDMRARLTPPSGVHWFGTDEFGRDVLSRVLAGAPYSLVMGFGATAISLAVGVP